MTIWQNYWTANKIINKILLLLTMVSTNVNIVCQEDLPVGVNPVKHFFTILFKHSQLKALVKLVLLQLPQLQWDLVKNIFISISLNLWKANLRDYLCPNFVDFDNRIYFLGKIEGQVWGIILVEFDFRIIISKTFLGMIEQQIWGIILVSIWEIILAFSSCFQPDYKSIYDWL